jgi:adenine-specific DNA glycosylase
MLLIRTQVKRLLNLLPQSFKKYPDIQCLAQSDFDELQKFLQPLELQNKWTQKIKEFTTTVSKNGFPTTREEVEKLPFAGRYVADVFSFFLRRSEYCTSR